MAPAVNWLLELSSTVMTYATPAWAVRLMLCSRAFIGSQCSKAREVGFFVKKSLTRPMLGEQ